MAVCLLTRTGQSAAVIVPPASVRIGDAALAVGDEIALFTEAGRCAGRAVWQDGGALALTAWRSLPGAHCLALTAWRSLPGATTP